MLEMLMNMDCNKLAWITIIGLNLTVVFKITLSFNCTINLVKAKNERPNISTNTHVM